MSGAASNLGVLGPLALEPVADGFDGGLRDNLSLHGDAIFLLNLAFVKVQVYVGGLSTSTERVSLAAASSTMQANCDSTTGAFIGPTCIQRDALFCHADRRSPPRVAPP